MDGPRPFPEAPYGYEREAVERFVEAADRERAELAGRLEETLRERDALEQELAALRGELDATKAAMPQIAELQARLEGLEGEYAKRVRALEAILASAAREVAERREGSLSSDDDEIPETPVIRGSWGWAPAASDDG